MQRIIKFLPWLNVGMNVIAFFPFTLHIIITDGGAFGFGYLALPFTVFMNIRRDFSDVSDRSKI